MAIVLSLGGSMVLAQDGPPVDPTAPPEGAGSQPASRTRVQISPRDMVTKGAELIKGMQGVLTKVVRIQETARRQKDVIKLNCVNDKLLQVKQLLNIAEGANTNLQEAIARSDEESRFHEFGRIEIASQQASILVSEAENCVGEDLTFIGPTEVIIEEGKNAEDMAAPEEPEYPQVEAPPAASPYI